MSNKMLIERLRTMCADIRRKPIALEHLIPLMQEAATEMERLRAEVEALTAQLQSGESFHAVAVHQRDAAWGEVETLKATLTQQCKGFRADVEKLEAEVEALKADVDDAAPAAPQQAEPVGYFVNDESDDQWHQVDYEQRNGADTYPLYLHPPADEVQQAEPVAQIGWADEFGNIFPMGAWKPAQRTHHDSHKAAWRPVFLHPPAAEVQRLREALEYLIEKCGDSDDAQYSTLGTKFVRDIARRALEGA